MLLPRQEIEKGIGDTGVMPGHVKVAIEEDFSEPEVNALRAGARVARRTGFSMTVHQGLLLGPDAGLRIADLLAEEKLELDRVVIAHNDGNFVEHDLRKLILEPESWALKLDIARKLLERGLNLSIDCFGHYWDAEVVGVGPTPDWQRMAGLVKLIQEGHARQLVLGTDTFIKFLKNSRLMEGFDEINMPGEIEYKRRQRLEKEGILIDDTTWQQLFETAESVNLQV